MTRRSRIWLVLAVLFFVGNLAGAIYAAVLGEMLHAGGHLAVLFPTAGLILWLLRQRASAAMGEQALAAGSGGARAAQAALTSREIDARLTHIERSVDSVALEVERIGEGQRFITRVFAGAESPEPQAAADDAPRRAATPTR